MAEILNRRLVRKSMLVTAVVVAMAMILQQGAASSQAQNDEPRGVFGAKIIDIALTLDEAAMRSSSERVIASSGSSS